MRYEFNRSAASLNFLGPRKPSITGITRLETQPTAINLQAGLAAPLADPLWLLARQWQFNEFQGEDAGTPLRLSFAVQGTKIDWFRAGDDAAAWQAIGDHDVPIETRVEAEAAWDTHPRLRGEAGQHALRMASASVRAALLAAYPFTLAAPRDVDADRPGLLWSTLLDARTIDAISLATDIRPFFVDAKSKLSGLPATLALGGADADAAQAMLARWLVWLDAMLYEGDAAHPSWQRNRMEYAFELKGGDTQLNADEYTDGHLDWDDFRATAGQPSGDAVGATFSVASRHPTPVRYPGMPAERFWEFEDGDVNFAGAEAGVTDLLRMSVTEFALTFGNDWFLVPVRLPVGFIHQVTSFTITDSFGVAATAGPIANPDGAQWTMYSMTGAPALQGRLTHAMFIPDSLDGVQEGAILEETMLARDEMANLAWAIERTVQGSSGEPIDRDLEARGLAFQQRIAFDGAVESPQLVYRLQTPVPANWTPLLPVRDTPLNLADPLTIRLARAGMRRFYPEASVAVIGAIDPAYVDFLDLLDSEPNFITRVAIGDGLRAYDFFPRGWMLRRDPRQPMADDDTLLIEEEEVPRIGATLRRKFQYARSSDGRSWLWVGRSKTAGRGEAQSALRFDVAVKRDASR